MSINTKMNRQIVVWLHFSEKEKTKTKLEHKGKSHNYLDEEEITTQRNVHNI